MRSIKEKRILVKWAMAMNEPVDPALEEEVERYEQLQREVTESIKSNTIKDLLGAAQGVKLSAESINIPAPAQVIKIEYPKPPSLYELELLLQEVQDELVQAHPSKESFTDQAPATEKNTAVEIKNDSLIERASKHITQEVKNESQSYQQPDPELPGRNIDDLRKKIKYLEAWISKISLTGPGGGEVNLLKLDDVDTSAIGNGKYLRYNAANAKIEFATVTGGSGIALTDLSVTVDAPNGNGNLVYDNNTGIFNFTPVSLANKANVSDLTTANVIELTNLYFTNARVVSALTAGQNITLDANGRINSTTTGGSEADTLATVTNRGNVTTNGITINNANADFFAVNTAANFSVTTGQIAWNSADLTFDMGMANGVTLQVGQEQYIKVKAGSAISDGQAVMFAGVSGEHIIAVPNNALTAGYKPEWFIGIATQDLAHNAFGYITVFGKVHNVNTLAYTEGDLLYADPLTAGGLTKTEPAAPYPHIVVAAVTKRAGGDGHILVRPTWRPSLSQISDTSIVSPTAGQVLTYQGNVWFNRNITSANVTELTNLYYTNARARQAISVAGAGSYDNITGIITITSSSSYNDANTYSNVTLLGYITSSSLSGYATNAQLASYATNSQLSLYATNAQLSSYALSTSLTTANVSEVTNLYFTNARVFAAVTGNLALKANVVDLTTANVIELNSLYFTDARARQAISTSGCTLSYSNTTGIISFSQGNTDTINEGSTNLYYTNARVYANVTSIGYIKEVANTSPITTSNTQGVVTIGLSPSGVSAATYGNATIVPVFTVDTFGRITSASNATIVAGITAVANTAPISATTSGSTATIAHLNSGVTANTYGGINRVPVITVNATGHITSSSNVAIAPRVMAILGFLNS